MDDPTAELFTCPRMPGGLRLLPSSCARNYQLGKRAESWTTAGHCKGCEIGAIHAGEMLPPAVEHPHDCRTCGRCSPRLVFGVICVSCFNRLAEAMRGRNARGKTPCKWRAVQLPDGTTMVRMRGLQFQGRGGRVQWISRALGIQNKE